MPTTPTKDDLLDSLETDAEVYFSGGRTNNLIDIGLAVSAIITSLVAAAVSATDLDRWIRVGAAAIPVALTSVQRVVEVRSRSNWYFTYSARLRSLATTLTYSADPDLQAFGEKRAAIDLDMEAGWGQIGRAGTKAVVKGRKRP